MLTYDDCLAFMDLTPEEAAAAPGLPALVGLRPGGRRARAARTVDRIAPTAPDTGPAKRRGEAAGFAREAVRGPARLDLAA